MTSDAIVLLNLVVPYWIKFSGVNYIGPGAFRLVITVEGWQGSDNPTAPLQRATIRITDLDIEAPDDLSVEWRRQFEINPFQFIQNQRRCFALPPEGPDRPRLINKGYVWFNWQTWWMLCHPNPKVGMRPSSVFDGNCSGAQYEEGMSETILTVIDPRPEQIQAFLDCIAVQSFEWRMPPSPWQLQFDVGRDLTFITVAAVEVPMSQFGCFYRDRRESLNEESDVVTPRA